MASYTRDEAGLLEVCGPGAAALGGVWCKAWANQHGRVWGLGVRVDKGQQCTG